MTNLTELQVLKMANELLTSNEMGYDSSEGLTARFSGETELRDGSVKPVWVVSYVTPQSLFEQHDHFIYISDESKDILYIVTQSGYIG